MSPSEEAPPRMRGRREPPAFRPVTVRRVNGVSGRMVRVTFGGPELEGLIVDQPAASVRVLLPPPGAAQLVVPTWNGNEFLLPNGARPIIRTLTPWRVDADALELDVGVVLHGSGAASTWAQSAAVDAEAAISGPGRGYTVDRQAAGFVLAGDETAIPAMSQLLEVLPPEKPVLVHIEIAHADARFALPGHAAATVEWHELPPDAAPGDALVAAVRSMDLEPDTRIWAAGEAAAVQRIRRHLFEDRGVARAHATVRGYWKHGRSADADAD